jgi:hypothetical protein
MPPRKLTEEQIANLKFDDCRLCKFVINKKKCGGCDAGENFAGADDPADVVTLFNRFG